MQRFLSTVEKSSNALIALSSAGLRSFLGLNVVRYCIKLRSFHGNCLRFAVLIDTLGGFAVLIKFHLLVVAVLADPIKVPLLGLFCFQLTAVQLKATQQTSQRYSLKPLI